MTWKDKLEIGLKEDAAFRKDNLPESQVRGPELDTGPGRSHEIPAARKDRALGRIESRTRRKATPRGGVAAKPGKARKSR